MNAHQRRAKRGYHDELAYAGFDVALFFAKTEWRIQSWALLTALGAQTLPDNLAQDFLRRARKAYGLPDEPCDIHAVVACRVFSKAYDEITPEQRLYGKLTNYSNMYGGNFA